MASTVSLRSPSLGNLSLQHIKCPANVQSNDHPSSKQPESTQQSPLNLSAFCFGSSPSGDAHDFGKDEKGSSVSVSSGKATGPSAHSASPSELLLQKRDKNSVRDHFVLEKSEVKSAAPNATAKIFLKFRRTSRKPEVAAAETCYAPSVDAAIDTGDKSSVPVIPGEHEGSGRRTWNLRPRKGLKKIWQENAGAPKEQKKSTSREKKDEEQKFSVPLSEEEIKADFLSMTGSKPSKRPKKRAKNVQKQLDDLFPGSRLGSIKPNSYTVRK